MDSRFASDLRALDRLAYYRREHSEPEIRRYHALRSQSGDATVAPLERLYHWMFVPITLWPFNIQDVFAAGLNIISAGREMSQELRLLLRTVPEPPSEEVCAMVARHEHDVRRGSYEELVTTTAKFEAVEREGARDVELVTEWAQIKELYHVDAFRDLKGVIRRSRTAERNLREPFRVDWKKRAQRFQAVFDAFCYRWNLYGMQGDKPLLLKLSVNLTPYGTMIFVPSYWSFDAKRDVRWDSVMKLHRARAPKKQGAALAEGVEQRRVMAARLFELDAEAKRRRLRGEKRHAFLCNALGLVEGTDPKRLNRLRKEFSTEM